MKVMPERIIRVLAAFVFLLPILALAHELLVMAVATSVAALADGDWLYQFVRQFLASPIHAQILVETLGGVQPRGIAVAGLPGDLLHAFAPALFLDPQTLPSAAWISAIVDKNSTVLAFFAMQVIAEFVVIAAGGLILQGGLRRRSLRSVLQTAPSRDVLLVLAGLLSIAQGIEAAFMLTLSPELAGLRETGIGVGFSLLFQVDKQQYNWLMDQALPMSIPAFVTAAALGVAWLAGKMIRRMRAHFTPSPSPSQRSFAARVMRKAGLAAALVPFLIVATIVPRYYGIAETVLVASVSQVAMDPAPPVGEPAVLAAAAPPTLPAFTATPATPATPVVLGVAAPAAPMTPVVTRVATPTPINQRLVELQRDGARFRLVVNNQATYVSGLNYNVNYTVQPDESKRRYHRRDFQLMRSAGVNAVVGWGVYDRVTLDIAREYDIGVIMPFELDAKGPFENKKYREQIKEQFRKFVLAYKDAPAVWGWNPGGDELLHRLETELHRTPDKLQIASDFLLELCALAYSIDPNHVSFVKEPRDSYVPYIAESVRRARLQKPAVDPSKYFVFAVNTYGKPEGVRLVLSTTRQSIEERVGIALAVGEFAPFGLARSERPAHYVQMWNGVRANSTIGGFAYVFGPDQPNPKAPNPYDPLRLLVSEFSLVDNEGNPVDGSLNALATQWKPGLAKDSTRRIDAR